METQKDSVIHAIPKHVVRGLTLVAPAAAFSEDPTVSILEVGASALAVIPYAWTPANKKEVLFDRSPSWWGEQSQGVRETVRLAKKAKLDVMLKPQLWIHGQWVGNLHFDSESQWASWSSSYRRYIMHHAHLAQELKVDIFCMSTELKSLVRPREAFFRELISDIRKVYQGHVTYAANWDAYQDLPFWDDLDSIGVNAYFPLLRDKTPSTESLIQAWEPIAQQLETFSALKSRPILFTEFGYLSVDGAAYNTWELEPKRTQLPVNEAAQAHAIDALLRVFKTKGWWYGGFLWKWYATVQGEGQARSRDFWNADYTPQGKAAQQIIKAHYLLHQ